MSEIWGFLINIGGTAAFLAFAYGVGHTIEKNHFRRLLAREKMIADFLCVSFPYEPQDKSVTDSDLVMGSVVISLDYFKRFASNLKGLIGGRLGSYESLLTRARREAILRMKAEARRRGYQAISNVRLETSRLASARGDGKGTAGVEILAFGTALKFDR